MKTALALPVLLLAAVATSTLAARPASASPWPCEPPAGWVEDSSLATGQMAQLRNLPQTKSVSATIFISPEHDAQLTIMTWDLDLTPISKDTLKQFDAGMAQGAAEKATTHVNDARYFENNRMIGTSTDKLNGMRIVYKRIYGVDQDDVVHMVSAICTTSGGPNPCDAAQASLHLDLPNAADIDDAETKDSAKQIGIAAGVVIVVLLVIWGTRRFRR